MNDERATMNDSWKTQELSFFHRSALRIHRFFFISLAFVCLACAASADAQGAWEPQRSGTFAWLHSIYFLDAQRGWAVGGNGALLATVDGGGSWLVKPRPTEDALRDVYFADAQNGWLVCERAVYRLATKDEPRTYLMSTADGGTSWKRVNVLGVDVDARLVRALFAPDGRGWTFGEAGALYVTRDYGQTWARQRVPTRYLLLGGAFLDSSRVWLVGAGATILQTADNGETWHACAVMDEARVRFTAVSFVDARRGWAVGAAGRIFSTRDGGRTWRAQASNVEADLLDVKFTSAREGWACGTEGTLLHTSDGGASWSVEPSGTTHPLERLYFITSGRGWAVGFGGTIINYNSNTLERTPELRRQK